MSHFRELFVAKTPERVASMIEGFAKLQEHLCTPKVFLFADWRTIRETEDFLHMPWHQADRATVQLLD